MLQKRKEILSTLTPELKILLLETFEKIESLPEDIFNQLPEIMNIIQFCDIFKIEINLFIKLLKENGLMSQDGKITQKTIDSGIFSFNWN